MDDNNPHIGTLLLVVGGIVTGNPEVWIPAATWHMARVMEIDKAVQVYFDESDTVKKLASTVSSQTKMLFAPKQVEEPQPAIRMKRQDKPRFRPTHAQPANNIPALIEDLSSANHLQFIGHTGGGKTTLIHALATMRWNDGGEVIVLDPKYKPGYWPGCLATGLQNDYEDMRILANSAWCEVLRRYQWFNAGYDTGQLEPLTIIVDEYDKIASEITLIDKIFEETLRRGRELKVRFVMGVQDSQAETVNLHGRTHLLKNFTYVVSCHYNEFDDSRYAIIKDGNGRNETKRTIPMLPDFHELGQNRDMSELNLPPLRDRLVLNNTDTGVSKNSDNTPVSNDNIPVSAVSVPNNLNGDEYVIYCLLADGNSKNSIYQRLGGNRNERWKQITNVEQKYFKGD